MALRIWAMGACLWIGLGAPALAKDSGPPIKEGAAEGIVLGAGTLKRLQELGLDAASSPGFAVWIIDKDAAGGAAIGLAAPDGRKMGTSTPFRLASVTKTFVAAAVLRLYETGRIDMDASIDGLISKPHAKTLSDDGYDTGAITVRHLLMHAGGLADHAQSDVFLEMVLTEPDRKWTRSAQISLMAMTSDPLSKPGEQFHYSDTGYVLLGEIIERITGQTLPEAVRELNRFEALGLTSMRWEGEAPDPNLKPRAHQYYGGQDITFIDGSMDAFGGGGLIATTTHMALYFRALFSGYVFDKPETLDLMLAAPGHPEGSPYRIGLFVREVHGHTIYSHGGFWGVYAGHAPSLDLTLAGVSLDEKGESAMRAILSDVMAQRAGS